MLITPLRFYSSRLNSVFNYCEVLVVIRFIFLSVRLPLPVGLSQYGIIQETEIAFTHIFFIDVEVLSVYSFPILFLPFTLSYFF